MLAERHDLHASDRLRVDELLQQGVRWRTTRTPFRREELDDDRRRSDRRGRVRCTHQHDDDGEREGAAHAFHSIRWIERITPLGSFPFRTDVRGRTFAHLSLVEDVAYDSIRGSVARGSLS